MTERKELGYNISGKDTQANPEGVTKYIGFQGKVLCQQLRVKFLARDEMLRIYFMLYFFICFTAVGRIPVQTFNAVGNIFYRIQYMPEADKAFQVVRLQEAIPVCYKRIFRFFDKCA